MKLAERLITTYFNRLSQEEKEELFARVVAHFFQDMTADQKQELIEQAIERLLEGVDMKEFLPRLMGMLWKKADSDEVRKNIVDKMSRMATDTSGKIADMLPSRLKKMF